MVKRNVVGAVFLLLTWSSLQAGPKGKAPKVTEPEDQVVTVGLVDGDATDEMSIINIRLSAKPAWKALALEDHGSFIQVSLPNTVVPEPGKFLETKSPFFEKIVLYQAKPALAIARIFTKGDAGKIRKYSDAEVLDSRIVITLDHMALAKELQATKAQEVAHLVSEVKPAEEEVKEEAKQEAPLSENTAEVKAEAVLEVKETKKEAQVVPANLPASEVSIDLGKSKLNDYLLWGAIASLVLFALILLSLSYRRVLRGRLALETFHPSVQMKAISHLNLAPKQRLSLVQVGNEKILLSVCPDQITLITHIKDETSDLQIKKLQSAPAEAQGALASHNKVRPAMTRPAPANRDRPREQSPGQAEQRSRPIEGARAGQPGKKVNFAVGDDGITNNLAGGKNQSAERAIEDVTKLIRDKLKMLPKI